MVRQEASRSSSMNSHTVYHPPASSSNPTYNNTRFTSGTNHFDEDDDEEDVDPSRQISQGRRISSSSGMWERRRRRHQRNASSRSSPPQQQQQQRQPHNQSSHHHYHHSSNLGDFGEGSGVRGSFVAGDGSSGNGVKTPEQPQSKVDVDDHHGLGKSGTSSSKKKGSYSTTSNITHSRRDRSASTRATTIDLDDELDDDELDDVIKGIPSRQQQHKNRDAVQQKKKNLLEKKKINIDDEDDDPYDSDPGESYRQHCMRMNNGVDSGTGSRSCLNVPGFLKSKRIGAEQHPNHIVLDRKRSIRFGGDGGGNEIVPASSPSPMARNNLDFMGPIPPSLPANLQRVRYSLRSSITDGSETQPVGPSVMERRELRPNNVHMNVSHWSDTGGRPYMEDRYVIEDLDAVQVEVSPIDVRSPTEDVEVTYGPKKTRRLTMPLTFFAVYDGHGGDKASQYCADWMTAYVRHDESYPYDLGYSMKNAFTTIDDDFVGTGQTDGTTACAVTMVGGRRIVCANAGDSRAVVVRRDGSIVRLSRDHKPGIPDETRRISELGGRVIYWGRWRVEGLLAVSRSVGDASLKPYITAEPEICEYDVGKDDLFLVMSSDGVWDVMDNEEAAHVVIASSCTMENGKLQIDTDRFKWAARNLCEHARSCGSTDNFSVIIADLKSCGNSKAAVGGRYEP